QAHRGGQRHRSRAGCNADARRHAGGLDAKSREARRAACGSLTLIVPPAEKHMLLTIAVIVVFSIAALLIAAAAKPDPFHVQRTARIAASPQAIYPHISNLRSHGAWSPFDTDPATRRTFNGAANGKGQVLEWEGDRKAGASRIEITDAAAPSKVIMKLNMS